ncbi:hypothetical protein A3A40_03400 [Candidatus Kaiserbacteria bacterium RIFCSPLOWO2_01_FULL_54_20]|uniref:Histidine biosynthesis bifunctional protein HisIE n=1 Tax=Candidatus Kaiserbacteria bacterium RIFCSPLOWO2_01_FULL_54_20 TaxID=1798513 RepID=A0A1F6EK44_9BACT|nr:MAG: hypothetical protein A3A40_03400 [Candidatus Kaiserbacteria bacterium RIFCSPLOWO2_01_FULL_54_20]
MKNLTKKIDWEKGDGLVPTVVQDESGGAVLMVGYMNPASLEKTMKTGRMWFYSRSKGRLWMKGEKSKNYLRVADVMLDCDNDTLLIKVRPAGPTCHTGAYSCFGVQKNIDVLAELCEVIADRKKRLPRGSYTSVLLKSGVRAISSKIAEEALEVVQAAKYETKKRLTEEAADLVYHLLVLLLARGLTFAQVEEELQRREGRSGLQEKASRRS